MQGGRVKGGSPPGGPTAAAHPPARLCHRPRRLASCLLRPVWVGGRHAAWKVAGVSFSLGPELAEGHWVAHHHWVAHGHGVVLHVRSFVVSLLSRPLASAKGFPASLYLRPVEAGRRARFVGCCVLPGGSRGHTLAQLGRWSSEEPGMACVCGFC